MKRIVASVGPAVRERLRGSILVRHDVEVRWLPDVHAALQALLQERPDLFVVHSPLARTLPYILLDFAQHCPPAKFSAVVLGDGFVASGLPPFVRAVLPEAFDLGMFNDAVAALIKLPTRRSARIPVRLGLSLAPHAGTQVASTVNLSGTGMLVEAIKPLAVGKTYEFRFLCKGNRAEQPPLRARVLRLEGPVHPGLSAGAYAMEFEGVSPEAMESFLHTLLPS